MSNSVWSSVCLSLTVLALVSTSSPAYISQLAPLRPPHFLPAKHSVYQSPLVGDYNGGPELEKHNCSQLEVEEAGEICTPGIVSSCAELPTRRTRASSEYSCYNISSTVCSVQARLVTQSVCRYDYQYRLKETELEAVEVNYEQECRDQSVTVCDPHSLHHLQQCGEISQETCHLQPRVKRSQKTVEVKYPEPVLTCADLTTSLPTIQCQVVVREACITQPLLHHSHQTISRCVSQAGEEGGEGGTCRTARLSLPSQTCRERDFGAEL